MLTLVIYRKTHALTTTQYASITLTSLLPFPCCSWHVIINEYDTNRLLILGSVTEQQENPHLLFLIVSGLGVDDYLVTASIPSSINSSSHVGYH